MRYILPLLFILTGCVSTPSLEEDKAYTKSFRASFDEVWRAAQQAVISYPLKVNNMEQGTIQTTLLRSHTYFKPPHLEKRHAGGYRYDLQLTLIKESKTITAVSLQKKLQVYKDFISKPVDLVSDGLEESALLYRIEREIEIDRNLTKQSSSQ